MPRFCYIDCFISRRLCYPVGHCLQGHLIVPTSPIMPLFATNIRFLTSRLPPSCTEYDDQNLSSFFGQLAVQPERDYTKQGGYESALTVAQAVRDIDLCYACVSLSMTSQDFQDRRLTLPCSCRSCASGY